MMDLYNVFKSRKCVIGVFALNSLLLLSSCGGCSCTTNSKDTENRPDSVNLNFADADNALQKGNLALYVDYSTCMAPANSSDFLKKIESSFIGADPTYYSIKGKNITKEDGNPYNLFRTIQEVQFADIKTAAQNIVDGNTEGALLTDGEYYESVKVSNSKGHVNDPYLKDVFKKWLRDWSSDVCSSDLIYTSYRNLMMNQALTQTRTKCTIRNVFISCLLIAVCRAIYTSGLSLR